jgi:ABC-type cobalamin/Fe3+-siderophores transport system ATPase subunit
VSTLSFDLVSHTELSRVSAAFAAGTRVVLGTERDGTNTLLELAAGITRPSSGRVTLDGREPFVHAEIRRRVSALRAEERLPPAPTVTSALTFALAARGDSRSAQSVLDAAGLSSFAARRVKALSAREVRAVALALALSQPEPALLALFEPLSLLGLLNEDFLLDSLSARAAAGAIVLLSASRLEDAARLGGTTSALERGNWLDSALVPLGFVTLRVRTPDARRLAAQLSECPDVSAVEWAGGQELSIRGADLERVAAQIVSRARAAAIPIEALRYDPPSLEALAATRAGLAQAFYERARHSAQSPTQEPIFTNSRSSP